MPSDLQSLIKKPFPNRELEQLKIEFEKQQIFKRLAQEMALKLFS
jgi:hypothetical protein